MARMTCPLCDKTFRKQTGMAWDRERLHDFTPESFDGSGDASIDGWEAGFEAVQTRVETLEEIGDTLCELRESLNSFLGLRDQVVSI